jgi:hypothetical protein
MALRRKKTASEQAREFKLRLPSDVSQRIVAKAEKNGWPQNRVIINELAEYPALKEYREQGDQISAVNDIVAKYGARITWLELSEQLLDALDVALDAQGTAQQAALDKVRVLRNQMRREQEIKRKGNE